MTSISAGMITQPGASTAEFQVRKARTEEDYFNEDDDEDYSTNAKKAKQKEQEMYYQPAPGSPGGASQEAKKEDSDSEEDPLDAFMANLEKDAQKKGLKSSSSNKNEENCVKKFSQKESDSKKGVRQDIEEADDEESYYKWLEENPNAGRYGDENEDDLMIEYDADGNPIVPLKSKHIDPLAALDHTQINYKPFEKCFYSEHQDIMGLSRIQVIDLQHKLGIRVSGASPPKVSII